MKKNLLGPHLLLRNSKPGQNYGEKKLALFSPLCRIKMTKLETFMQMSESEGDRAKLVQR